MSPEPKSTIQNVTMTHGVVSNLIVEQSIVDNVQFLGRVGDGVRVDGIAAYDSVWINGAFGGNTVFGSQPVVLERSLMIANSNGLLQMATPETAKDKQWKKDFAATETVPVFTWQQDVVLPVAQVEASASSEFRDQRIQTRIDDILGLMPSRIVIDCRPDGLGTKPIIFEKQDDQPILLGKKSIADQLSYIQIGYQPLPEFMIKKGWSPAAAKTPIARPSVN